MLKAVFFVLWCQRTHRCRNCSVFNAYMSNLAQAEHLKKSEHRIDNRLLFILQRGYHLLRRRWRRTLCLLALLGRSNVCPRQLPLAVQRMSGESCRLMKRFSWQLMLARLTLSCRQCLDGGASRSHKHDDPDEAPFSFNELSARGFVSLIERTFGVGRIHDHQRAKILLTRSEPLGEVHLVKVCVQVASCCRKVPPLTMESSSSKSSRTPVDRTPVKTGDFSSYKRAGRARLQVQCDKLLPSRLRSTPLTASNLTL